MAIDIGGCPPIAKKPFALALKHCDWIIERFAKLLEAHVIRGSHSRWPAQIVVVSKGDGGKMLFVNIWPMPRVKDIFTKIGQNKMFHNS